MTMLINKKISKRKLSNKQLHRNKNYLDKIMNSLKSKLLSIWLLTKEQGPILVASLIS